MALAGALIVAGATMLVWLMGAGIASAESEGGFGPQDAVSRQDMVILVYRALDVIDDGTKNGSVAGSYGCATTQSFVDVGEEHSEKVACLAGVGVVAGYSDNTFRPDVTLTRQHAAAFAYRLLDVADDKERNDSVAATYGCDPAGRFGDVSGVHTTAINCLSAIGVIAGYPDGTFRPSVTLTRQHVAAFVHRTLDVVDDGVRNDSVECDRSARFDDVRGTHAAAINCLADLGLYDDGPSPAGAPDPLVFSSISAGSSHVCGILADTGEVRCWGSNYEEAGIVYYGQATPPGGVFTSVSAGSEVTCGIRPDESVACWGGDDHGESSQPGGKFSAVSAGGNHACGLRPDGTVRCWGLDHAKQASPPSGEFVDLSAGGSFTCAVRANGSVRCWGTDLAEVTSPPTGRFTTVSAGTSGVYACGRRTTGVVECWGSVSGRGESGGEIPPRGRFSTVSVGYTHACGLRSGGTVECWGRHLRGRPAPDGRFAAISSGVNYTCGLRPEGTVECWGSNEHGRASPPAGPYVSVTRSDRHGCGLREDGAVECWGSDEYGQATPVEGYVFTSVSAGDDHTCALTDDYRIRCWGSDLFGQSTPPSTGRKYLSVTAGPQHTCAVQRDHSVACWGRV